MLYVYQMNLQIVKESKKSKIKRTIYGTQAVQSGTCASVNVVKLTELGMAFLKASERVHGMKKHLEEFNDCLLVEGEPYPALQEIQADDLKRFIEWVKEHAECKPLAGTVSTAISECLTTSKQIRLQEQSINNHIFPSK